jgi:hypothetical protein
MRNGVAAVGDGTAPWELVIVPKVGTDMTAEFSRTSLVRLGTGTSHCCTPLRRLQAEKRREQAVGLPLTPSNPDGPLRPPLA